MLIKASEAHPMDGRMNILPEYTLRISMFHHRIEHPRNMFTTHLQQQVHLEGNMILNKLHLLLT